MIKKYFVLFLCLTTPLFALTEQEEFREIYNLGVVEIPTNMPIARFGSTLVTKNQFNDYMFLLKSSFQKNNLRNVMCRTLLSIDYEGNVYDCDFNQMLKIGVNGVKRNIKDIINIDKGQKISVGDHCYGCTAGSGSSCGGDLIE